VTSWASTDRGKHLRGRKKVSTAPEVLLRKALHALGARFRLHRRLAKGCTPDIVMPSRRLAVFVDGDYWHSCPVHGRTRPFTGPNAVLWEEKMARNKERDLRSTRLAEEVGWTGFLQARLQERHGPLKASLIVTVPFALFQLPGWMVEFEQGLSQFHLALLLTGVFGISQLFGRVIIMWLYNNTHYSVLLVGMFHSSFNVTTSAFGPFIPRDMNFLIAAGAVAVAAVLIVVFTRGRLSYESERTPQPATP
jgi:DNA mismatch endonuclease, patch repair protein